MINGLYQQEDTNIVNVYAPILFKTNVSESKGRYMLQQNNNGNNNGKIQHSTFISRQINQAKINQQATELTYTINQMDLIYIYRIFPTTATKYTFFFMSA